MGPTIIIPTGNMIFFQFSTKANTKIEFDGENGVITVRSLINMEKGDELFIDYTSLYPKNELEQESMFSAPDGVSDEMMQKMMEQGMQQG
tara:strand:- start:158 stop:427 length:270 start_codon:yes stop_codon:yes gene_type:complete